MFRICHSKNVNLSILQSVNDDDILRLMIASDGSKKILKKRDASKVDSTNTVAKKVVNNIKKRKFITTLTTIGKLNKFLQARFPMLVERIILGNLSKFQEKSE